MDIRVIAEVEQPYFEINREERFFCATLYALLVQKNNNLKNFVSYLNDFLPSQDKVNTDRTEQFEIYVEYSYLRDIWNKIRNKDERRLGQIRDALNLSHPEKLPISSVLEFNTAFVGLGKPSESYIQNPGTWSISKYSKLFPTTAQGNEDFLKVCKFKWSFNIKPDLVIQTASNRALSIEAKLESGEGSYPSSDNDKKYFKDRWERDYSVGQLELQGFMFRDLLGIKASLFSLVKEKKQNEHNGVNQIIWKDVFSKLDFSETHPFILKALKKRGLV